MYEKKDSRTMYHEIRTVTQSFNPILGIIKDETGETRTQAITLLADGRNCTNMFKVNEIEDIYKKWKKRKVEYLNMKLNDYD